MSGMVEIKDQDEQGIVAVELIDLLNLIKSDGRQLIWAILDLEAVGNIRGKGMLDLEAEIMRSPKGLILNWDGLVTLARSCNQVVNATVIGCRDIAAMPELKPGSESDIYTPSEFVLEAIDSSLWCVYAKDDKVLRQLQKEFHAVEVLEVISRG
jgi:hypothetical protein